MDRLQRHMCTPKLKPRLERRIRGTSYAQPLVQAAEVMAHNLHHCKVYAGDHKQACSLAQQNGQFEFMRFFKPKNPKSLQKAAALKRGAWRTTWAAV